MGITRGEVFLPTRAALAGKPEAGDLGDQTVMRCCAVMAIKNPLSILIHNL